MNISVLKSIMRVILKAIVTERMAFWIAEQLAERTPWSWDTPAVKLVKAAYAGDHEAVDAYFRETSLALEADWKAYQAKRNALEKTGD